jgi:formamidopyrimidine-DNA glycosylase
VSIELPEAKILADQMARTIHGKSIAAYTLCDYERLQRIGMLNRNAHDFDQLLNRTIMAVTSRGNTIRMTLDGGVTLLLGPEYGGTIRYHTPEATPPGKFHLKVMFRDATALTVRLSSMGVIRVLLDAELPDAYLLRRDFNPQVPSPLDDAFTFDQFSTLLTPHSRMLKSVLVGKDAVVVGLSNSAFQDIIYRAHLHPKRKASTLLEDERRALYDALRFVVHERLRLGGTAQFTDLHGTPGGYTPAMGPHMRQRTCPKCGTSIATLHVGGGRTYFCPACQV